MRSRLQMIFVAALLAFPAGLGAQHIGFQVGIAPPRYGPVVPFGGAVHTYGAYNISPFSGLQPGGYVVPRIGHAPSATVVRSGTVIFVNGRNGRNVARGFQGTIPGVVIGNGGIAIVNGGNRRGRSPRPGYRTGFFPGSPVIPGYAGGVFVSGRNPGHGQFPAASHGIRVGIGSTRTAIIAALGSPSVSMVDGYGEVLVYGGTTYRIQNGVVTRVSGH